MKDQFVIAYLADLSMRHEVVSHALFLSRMLSKGLILLYVEDRRYGGATREAAEGGLKAIEAAHPGADTAHIALRGDTREVAVALPTMLNGVAVVAGVNPSAPRRSPTHPREVLRLFAECKIAFLTVQTPLDDPQHYQSVAFGIDFRKESKEKLIWASYFARFNRSRLMMMHFNYSDEGLRAKWRNNVVFMNKFFRSVGIGCEQSPVAGRALFPETLVCERAAAEGCGVLISVTTDLRDRDVVEWFAGTAEARTIQNPRRLPVLFLNPRDDLYLLCD